jgi:hypothetical protein
MPRVVIGDGLALNDSRFIPVQAILPYVQSEISQMYCLSPGACESMESYKFRVEDESLGFRSSLIRCPILGG